MTMIDLDPILPLVNKPGRYIGLELHANPRPWSVAAIHFALVFPDLYEIGMSHQGLQILYHIINRHPGLLAERAYVPDLDMEAELRRRALPLFSIESRRPLCDFEVIGISLPYELCYTNVLTVLDLAALPLRTRDRDEAHPLVIGGGSCGMNPEPVAAFFDAIVLGDGEEVVVEIGELLGQCKAEGQGRAATLERLAAVEGVYVPALFEPEYRDGRFHAIHPLRQHLSGARRRVLPRLPPVAEMADPIVPVVKTVHDRLAVEVARGCTRGCRFCQAGMLYRPVRERHPDEIMAIAEQGIAAGGYEELALLSLSTGDYSCLGPLMVRLMDRFAPERVSVSMPSMRVGTLTPEIMEQIKRVRKTGFTVAPEAGSDRLRRVINKGITEEDLLLTCEAAFGLGWNLIKFYFMVGLPTETDADVEAIVELAKKARQRTHKGTRAEINVSVGVFVPKPHTPFQWEAQLDLAASQAIIARLKNLLPHKGFHLKWHKPEQSYLEGVFARGDRRLADLIEAAWRAGARLDGWNEHFSLERWQTAAAGLGIDLDAPLKASEPGSPLPWDHLDCGVARAFLLAERERGLQETYTPDCRVNNCQGCGLCDFKTLRPLTHAGAMTAAPGPPAETEASGPVFTYRIHYRRFGLSRFFGHLEFLQLVFRALRRAGLPILYSQGFNPSPRVGFSQALAVGMESEKEFFDVDLARPLADPEAALAALNGQLPPGLRVFAITQKPAEAPGPVVHCYEIRPVDPPDESWYRAMESFLASVSFPIERVRKNKKRELDIRPMARRLEIENSRILLDLLVDPARASVSPREFLERVFPVDGEALLLARIKKLDVREA